MMQYYMLWGYDIDICDDVGDTPELLEFNTYIELNADNEPYSNFTFIKSEEIDEEFEVITLVRNMRRSRYRTDNWQEVIKNKLRG